MKLENIITLRYLKNIRNNNEISGSSLIVIIVIAVSIIFFIASVSIMNGYIYNIMRIQLEIDSYHVEIPAYTSFGDSAQLLEKIMNNKRLSNMIRYAGLFREDKVLLTANGRTTGILKFRAIPGDAFLMDRGLNKSLTLLDGVKSVSLNEIMISRRTADKLAVNVDDHVYITAMASDRGAHIILRRLKVAGIFTTGYAELDELLAYISNSTGDSLFDDETPYSIMIKLENFNDAGNFAILYSIPKVITKQFYSDYISGLINKNDKDYLFARYMINPADNSEYILKNGLKINELKKLYTFFSNLGLLNPLDRVITWKDKNEATLSALHFEKNVIAFIVILVVIVATLNILSTIYITAYEKRQDIAILKSMGLSPARVNAVFLLNGIYLSLIGIIAGVFSGLLIMMWLNEILQFFALIINIFLWIIHRIETFFIETDKFSKFEFFSRDFYLDKIYTEISYIEILFISFITLVFSIIASLIPAIRAGKIKPIEVIKNG